MDDTNSSKVETLADRLNADKTAEASPDSSGGDTSVTKPESTQTCDPVGGPTDGKAISEKSNVENIENPFHTDCIGDNKVNTGKENSSEYRASPQKVNTESKVNEKDSPERVPENEDCQNSEHGMSADDNMFKSCDKFEDSRETVEENASEDSGSEGEYESADEGEEIQTDAQNLREQEELLTDEEKEEKRKEAQVYKEEGNEYFRCGSYKTAIKSYSRALRSCPLKFQKDRAIMYSNRAACKMRLEDFESSIKDCSRALELHPHYLKALMRRAELYEKTEKLDEALADFQKILELDPSQHSARAACVKLPDMIKERNEKMKEEMMAKLKDLGNMVLRPFGLSTNNFKLNQDPNTGGYSVNFVQNPDQNNH